MENAYTRSTVDILKYFSVTEQQGLSDTQVEAAKGKYGRNGLQKLLRHFYDCWQMV